MQVSLTTWEIIAQQKRIVNRNISLCSANIFRSFAFAPFAHSNTCQHSQGNPQRQVYIQNEGRGDPHSHAATHAIGRILVRLFPASI